MIPEPNFPANPDEFVGRQPQIESFRRLVQQGLTVRRTISTAVLGDWGIGKSSLLLKLATICSESNYRMLPVFLSISKELGNYLNFAENLLDRLGMTLIAEGDLTTRLRGEVQNWKLTRVNVGGLTLDRERPQFFLSSGTALLRHALSDAWTKFLRPANLQGAVFFLDDLHNLTGPSPQDVALVLRDQFQSFGIEGINYSVCFSAPTDYFGNIRHLAEPAVRFYSKFYLTTFTLEEITQYVKTVFGADRSKSEGISHWLYEKALGHPYFLAFICRQLATHAPDSPPESPEHLWPIIFEELGKEKFRTDLAHATEKELGLLHSLATSDNDEVSPGQFGSRFQPEYFRRLTERGLLVRTGRGRYKLYHPLFKLFLQGLKP
jgi:hypothetical protein